MPGQDNSVCAGGASGARSLSPLPACRERPTREAWRVRGSLRESNCRRDCGCSPSPHPLRASSARPDPVRTGRGSEAACVPYSPPQENPLVTSIMIAALGLLMVGTAFLSGLFGMAGGLILIGVLLALMPLPTAMVLHAITQMASNGWRAFLWRAHIRWRPVANYMVGAAVALAAWSLMRYVPDKPIALLLLGITPFMARLMPASIKPNPDSVPQGTF